MPRDGAGTYNEPQSDVVTGTPISSTSYNASMADIASALTQSISRDGQTVPSANLPMGTFRHTGVGNGVARTDYAALGQVQDAAVVWGGTAGGTANAITLTLSPAITAYTVGMVVRFVASANNTGAVTININGVGAVPLQAPSGSPCTGGELRTGVMATAVLAGANWVLQNILSPATPTATPSVVGTVIQINTSSGAGYTTPSVGSWFYFLNLVVTATAANTGTQACGVAGPSTLVANASAGNQWQGFVWRVS